jgi:hypothetical protein
VYFVKIALTDQVDSWSLFGNQQWSARNSLFRLQDNVVKTSRECEASAVSAPIVRIHAFSYNLFF